MEMNYMFTSHFRFLTCKNILYSVLACSKWPRSTKMKGCTTARFYSCLYNPILLSSGTNYVLHNISSCLAYKYWSAYQYSTHGLHEECRETSPIFSLDEWMVQSCTSSSIWQQRIHKGDLKTFVLTDSYLCLGFGRELLFQRRPFELLLHYTHSGWKIVGHRLQGFCWHPLHQPLRSFGTSFLNWFGLVALLGMLDKLVLTAEHVPEVQSLRQYPQDQKQQGAV